MEQSRVFPFPILVNENYYWSMVCLSISLFLKPDNQMYLSNHVCLATSFKSLDTYLVKVLVTAPAFVY